jgi:gliding motility-associated-like protein
VSDKVGLLTVTPSVFTPNADHHNDFLQIDYRLPAPDGILTISVYDSRGKKIHDICHEQRVLEDRGMFSWNGEGRGVKIPTGMYVIYLEYKYQNRVVRAKRTAVLAR